MNQQLILLPVLAQLVLVFIVWIRLYTTRVAEMRAKRIAPQSIASAADSAVLLKNVAGPADNFVNQFELPVLFYLVCVLLYIMQLANPLYLSLACAFVVMRYVHSFIHLTYNRVKHRFAAYLIGSCFLWAMLLLLSLKLLSNILN